MSSSVSALPLGVGPSGSRAELKFRGSDIVVWRVFEGESPGRRVTLKGSKGFLGTDELGAGGAVSNKESISSR